MQYEITWVCGSCTAKEELKLDTACDHSEGLALRCHFCGWAEYSLKISSGHTGEWIPTEATELNARGSRLAKPPRPE